MSSRYAMSFAVPPGFPEILKNFTREILRAINMDQQCGESEVQILDWAQRYFSEMAEKNAPTLSQEQVFALAQKLFVAADANGSGSLDKDEMRCVLEDLATDLDIKKASQVSELVDRVMEVADVNDDGKVDYEEFLPVAVQIVKTVSANVARQAAQEQRELREVVEKIFDAYDEDRSGFLDASEFNSVFTDLTGELGLSAKDAARLSDEILRNVDVNGDGQVQRTEFMPIAMEILQTILDAAEAEGEATAAKENDEDAEALNEAAQILVHGFSQEELQETLLKIFSDADKDGSNKLDPQEFEACLASTDIGFTPDEIQLLKDGADTDNDGLIDFTEFAPLAHALLIEVIAQQIKDKDQSNDNASKLPLNAKSRAQQLVNDLSDEELEQTLRKIFDGADQDKNGVLDYDEFRECLRSANLGFTDDLIEYLIVEVDANNDQVIDYSEFCPLCYELLLKIIEVEVAKSAENESSDSAEAPDVQDANEEAEDLILGGMSSEEIENLLHDLFKAADADGSGHLDPQEFSQALEDSGISITPDQLTQLLNQLDTDGDGQINYIEFVPVAFEMLTQIVAETVQEEKQAAAIDGVMVIEEQEIRMNVFREEAHDKLVHGMTAEELNDHFLKIFKAADTDGSGELEYDEFLSCLQGSKLQFTEEEIDFLGSEADKDQNGTVSFEEFAPLAFDLLIEHMAIAIQDEHDHGMKARSEAALILSRLSKEEVEGTIMGLFKEADDDGSGLIEKLEFVHAMQEAKIGLKDPEIEALYEKVDTDGDGKVNYEEFAPLCYDILVEVLARQLAASDEDTVENL